MSSTLKKIFLGYKNLLFENAEIEAMAEKRLEHCENCEELDKYEFNIYGNKNIKFLFCGMCNCYVPSILRSPPKDCPKGKWNNL
jgi:hypothetical protein